MRKYRVGYVSVAYEWNFLRLVDSNDASLYLQMYFSHKLVYSPYKCD